MTYNDEATIQSQQDNTSSALNTSRTKSFEALNLKSTFMNFRAKMQASLNDFHLFLWLTVMSEKADNSEVNSENSFKDDNNIKNTQCVNSIRRSFDVNIDRLDSLFLNMQCFIYSVMSKKHSTYKWCSSFIVQEVEAQLMQIEQKEEEENCKEREEHCDTESCNKDDHEKRSCDKESCDRESCDRESCNKDDCYKESCDKESWNRESWNKESCNRASCDKKSCDSDDCDKESHSRESHDRESWNRVSSDSESHDKEDCDRRSHDRSYDRRSAFRKVAYSHNSEIRFNKREWHETSQCKRENTEQKQYNIERESSERQHVKVHKNKKKFVRTVKQLFQFFLLLHYMFNIIMKYWEAVYYLIDDVRRFTLKQTLKSTTKQQFVLE